MNKPRIIAIDAGHGQDNRRRGVYDSGAVNGIHHEADIALKFALLLETALTNKGIQTWLTRRDNKKPTPVGLRARHAEEAECTTFISIHVNDAEGPASGYETLVGDSARTMMHKAVHSAMLQAYGLTNRGIKTRRDLAVLKFRGPCLLIELGFIDTDLRNILDTEKTRMAVLLLTAALERYAR